jgi:hypothetical protein
MELCDEVYLSPEASMGVTPGGNVAEHWSLVMLGGIEILVRTPTAADVETLGQRMRDAKKRLSKSHPDIPGGTAERFKADYAVYEEALKAYEEASEKVLTNK